MQVTFYVQSAFKHADDQCALGFPVWSLIPLEQDEPFMTGLLIERYPCLPVVDVWVVQAHSTTFVQPCSGLRMSGFML